MTALSFWIYIGFLIALVLTNWRITHAHGYAVHNEMNLKKLHKMITANHGLILLLQDKRDNTPNNRDAIIKIVQTLEAGLPPDVREAIQAKVALHIKENS